MLLELCTVEYKQFVLNTDSCMLQCGMLFASIPQLSCSGKLPSRCRLSQRRLDLELHLQASTAITCFMTEACCS